jgi:hypothetical protein
VLDLLALPEDDAQAHQIVVDTVALLVNIFIMYGFSFSPFQDWLDTCDFGLAELFGTEFTVPMTLPHTMMFLTDASVRTVEYFGYFEIVAPSLTRSASKMQQFVERTIRFLSSPEFFPEDHLAATNDFFL